MQVPYLAFVWGRTNRVRIVLVEKEIIRPGTYWYINPETGLPGKLDATPEKVKHFHDSGKKMLAAGLSIPVPLEHDKSAHPLTPAEKLLNNAGFVKDYLMKPVTDEHGKTVDAMFGKIEVPDPKIAAKLPHTIKWTSPWITSFVDGNKNSWNEVIGHVALTTRPRITQQQPFPSVDMAMSHVLTLPAAPTDTSYAISRAGLLKVDGTAFKPAYPMAFSLLSGIALDAEGMKKTGSTPPDKKSESEKGGDVDPSSGIPGNPEEETLVDADGDIPLHEVMCDLLEAAYGVCLPEGTTKENFMERMYQASMEHMKSKGTSMDTPPAAPNTPPSTPNVVQEQPPLYMSLEQAQKIADPTLRGLALSLLETRNELLAIKKNALETAKTKRQERITRLAKWLPLDAKNKLLAQSSSMQFSMGSDGVVTDQMSETLDILEAGMREIPTLLTTDARFADQQQHPHEFNGEVPPERIDAATQAMTNRMAEEQVKPVPKPTPEQIRHMAG